MLENLKIQVYEANKLLPSLKLVTFTWGNVSGIDREKGIIAIKPSGVSYAEMALEDIVLIDINGEKIEGDLRPSSDTPTHLYLYKKFPKIGGIVHTHSTWATIFSQAGRAINVCGTTHADNFNGDIPVTDSLTESDVIQDYEYNTGKIIAETFEKKSLNYETIPAVLVKNHGPFTWGKSPAKAVENAKVLEIISEMFYHTLQLNKAPEFPKFLLEKHFSRKHGENAYYGQK